MKRDDAAPCGLYDVAVEAVRRETEAGLTAAELHAVRDHVTRRMRERESVETRRWPWVLSLATAGAVALVVMFIWPRQRVQLESPVEQQSARLVTHSGEVKVGDGATAPAELTVLPEGTQIALADAARARIAFGDEAEATMAGPGRLRVVRHKPWLEAGEVAFAVTPRAQGTEPFRVEIGRDVVLVHGARFAVFAERAQLQRVSVSEGVVEVRLDGGASTQTLKAGESFVRLGEAPLMENTPEHDAKGGLRHVVRPSAARTGPVRDLWDAAMTNLRASRCRVLHQEVADLVQQSQFAEDKAQALLLDAECAVRSSDKKAAIKLYENVVHEYPWTASAETALFEVATLQSDIGAEKQSLASTDAYLQRYPQGRFADAMRFRRCEHLVRATRLPEARECLDGYLRDFPSGVKAGAASEYLRRLGAP